MESNPTVLSVGVAAFAFVVTFFVYRSMGCTVSARVNSPNADKAPAEKNEPPKKEELKEKYPAGKVSIYFGSQTGTAEGFSRTLMEEGKAAGFNVKVIDLEEFDADILLNSTTKAIFLMATYGEGEATDNAIAFLKWMKDENNEIGSTGLSNLKYTVFGLGNKQYEHYNFMGRTTNKRMADFGATLMYNYGEGDDDASLEDDFEAWKGKLWPTMVSAFHPDKAIAAAALASIASTTDSGSGGNALETEGHVEQSSIHNSTHTTASVDLPSKVKLQFTAVPCDGSTAKHNYVLHGTPTASPAVTTSKSSGKAAATTPSTTSKINASTKHFFTAPRATIVVNRELRSNNSSSSNDAVEGSTRHIEIDLKGVNLTYHTADNLAILPENNPLVVASFANAMGFDLDYSFDIVPVEEDAESFKLTFPTPCTIREALTMYMDIQGPLKQAILKHLLPYTTDPAQVQWLSNLLLKENRKELKKLTEEQGKTLLDLLTNELSSCKIPFSDLLHIVPYIQPRYYTISSSSSCHPDNVHITVSITEYVLPCGQKIFTGLASGYLKRLQQQQQQHAACRVFVRASSFRLPASLATPIVMIGPGTGLAPMRALLQERRYQRQQQGGQAVCGDNVLFFGCKNKSVDYIYRDELEAYEREGVLTKLHTAFSRDSEKKVYVQHLMTEKNTALSLIDLVLVQGAHIYVCGATAMGSDVMHAFLTLLEEHRSMSHVEATALVKELQDKGRYVQELWTA